MSLSCAVLAWLLLLTVTASLATLGHGIDHANAAATSGGKAAALRTYKYDSPSASTTRPTTTRADAGRARASASSASWSSTFRIAPRRATKALSTGDELAGGAGRAVSTVGLGRAAAYGTRAHAAFEAEVNALGRSDLATEVSYLNGRVVPRGTAGSVRLDVGRRAGRDSVIGCWLTGRRTHSCGLVAWRFRPGTSTRSGAG